MPEQKRLFKVTRVITQMAHKVAYQETTIKDLVDNAPGCFQWVTVDELSKTKVEEIPLKEVDMGEDFE